MNIIAKTIIVLTLSLTSCSSVISNRPIGLEYISINPEDWNGIWLIDDNVVRVKVIDESKGVIKFALIEEKENDLQLECIVLQIMKGKKWLYANVLEMEGEKATDKYLWGRINNEDNKIVFWAPSVGMFLKAVESKKIKAIVAKKAKLKDSNELSEEETLPVSITLIDESKAIIDLVENGEVNFFEWDHPIVLNRLIK